MKSDNGLYTEVQTRIQSFGHLVVSTLDLQIIAVSEHVSALTDQLRVHETGTSLADFVRRCFGEAATRILTAIHEISTFQSPRKLILHNLRDRVYYINIYVFQNRLYMEWEQQEHEAILAAEMNEIGFLFEQNLYDAWSSLCFSIQKLLGFHQVAILQVAETGGSRVIAEACTAPYPVLLHTEFSEAYMSADIQAHYMGRAYLYTPDIDAETQMVETTEHIDLSPCLFKQFPAEHAFYMRSIQVVSALFLPIIIDNRFWGLVIAHHFESRRIDLQKRKLCSFIVQNAASKQAGLNKQRRLEHLADIKHAERELKSALSESKTIHAGLIRNIHTLAKLTRADGVAIYFQGENVAFGLSPNEAQLEEIITLFKQQTRRPLWKDYNFREKRALEISSAIPFAGLMVLQLNDMDDHYLVWFRKESVNRVLQIDQQDARSSVPRSEWGEAVPSFVIWERTVRNTAIPWDEHDISYALSVHNLINETIVNKSKENDRLHDELISLNNELEMLTFTLSHDLKNPLSIVKMGVQYMVEKKDVSAEQQQKWGETLLKGIADIENLVQNAVQLCQSKTYEYAKEPTPMASTIRSLCQEAQLVHNNPNCVFQLGKLHAICGEKSVLYQIFLNVIGNAVKYTSAHQAPQIAIDSVQDENWVTYQVEDNGIGIPSEHLPHVFDLFVRASNATTFDGTGVGLGLVRRIMDRLGGHISLCSELHKGTKVTMVFPRDCR
ncbi:sensor histidine kinase [Sphingobacterium suaedae]|uniref:histidine kinase n=1 Tax=Sphingobacterium suaedae TaxID=1686402 RepID=A0ABW5KD51_9SPHI